MVEMLLAGSNAMSLWLIACSSKSSMPLHPIVFKSQTLSLTFILFISVRCYSIDFKMTPTLHEIPPNFCAFTSLPR